MRKRTWVYCRKPTAYEIRCDLCGGSRIEWSEFLHMIWCLDCQKDTPGTGGIFDGPIPLEVAKMFGVSFDRIDIKTGKLIKMVVGKKRITWKEVKLSVRRPKQEVLILGNKLTGGNIQCRE